MIRDRIAALLWLGPVGLVLLAAGLLIAVIVRDLPAVSDFIRTYPGQYDLPAWAPVGFPAWLAWQHFFSAFLLLLLVRTGWEIRTGGRPSAFWTRTALAERTLPPVRMPLRTWLHLALDVLWIANGVLYVVLLFVTGQWVRIVPTSWEVIPHAVSAGIQYASLDWPTENGWVNYNSLQQLSYFATVFIASPLAIITGFRMSSLWNQRWRRFDRVFPMRLAKAVHLPVMLYFVAFTIVHVTLVLATGALRNLNHMYAVRDEASWVGAIIFAGSLLVMLAGWLFVRPSKMKRIAALGGTVKEMGR
ncbi:MAG TPA: hypothetical protein VN200_00485 [Rhodoglobus sp.]|nr:hypothetical protein [Rhodoglobus sp.]